MATQARAENEKVTSTSPVKSKKEEEKADHSIHCE
jgi:hypothetical protein